MSATATQPAAGSQLPGLKALGVFVGVGMVALAAALMTGATVVFAVLWMCFAAALVLRRAELGELWRAFRRRGLVVQAVMWLLFLPLAAALFIWERRWRVGVRLVLVLSIAAFNLFLFFPSG
jgi:hypothetical protein